LLDDPWDVEREVAWFCLGAFQDAAYLSTESRAPRVPLATAKGSPMQCIRLLMALICLSFGAAFLLPNARDQLYPDLHRNSHGLIVIQNVPTDLGTVYPLSVAQYMTWKERRQRLFQEFAFYRIVPETVSDLSGTKKAVRVTFASANLFQLLGLSIQTDSTTGKMPDGVPRIILSERLWRRVFRGDPDIFGRVLQLRSGKTVVAGIASVEANDLPGEGEAWIETQDKYFHPSDTGYVIGRLTQSISDSNWESRSVIMSAPKPDGSMANFNCAPLSSRPQGTWQVFLFAVFLACLALPATTSLPLGEYRVSSHKPTWPTRVRRWAFLACKLALLLPIVYLVSIDLAYLRISTNSDMPIYIELISAFSFCLFGLRWMLRDQRERCPVCLGKLTHPARVGEPSRSFLAWNGTELICVGGHGLLHVPEITTSWFGEQRWLYLDPSWRVLFAEERALPAGYF
jgi:hypothetical protein